MPHRRHLLSLRRGEKTVTWHWFGTHLSNIGHTMYNMVPHLAPIVEARTSPKAVSTITDAATVGEVRAALNDVRHWMTTVLTERGPAGYRGELFINLTGWLGQTRLLTNRLPDGADISLLPTGIDYATQQVAFYAANFADAYGIDPHTVPHARAPRTGDPDVHHWTSATRAA